MALEEDAVPPAALARLTALDWSDINARFALNAAPLTDTPYKDSLDQLLSLIVNLTPRPPGLATTL